MPKNGVDNKKNDERAQNREAKQEEKKRKDFADAKYKAFKKIKKELKKTCPKIAKRKYPKGVDELGSEIEKVLKGLQDFIDDTKVKLREERKKEFNPQDDNSEEAALCWGTRKRPQVGHDEGSNHPRQKSEAWPTKPNDAYSRYPKEGREFWLINDEQGKETKSREMEIKGKQQPEPEPKPDYPLPYSRHCQTVGSGGINEGSQRASRSAGVQNETVDVERDKEQWTHYENMEMEYKEKTHKLQQDVEKLKREINSLTQENGKLQKKLEDKKRQYVSQPEGARKEMVAVARDIHQWEKYENMEKDYTEKVQKLQEEVKSLKYVIDMLTQENSQLKKKLEANETSIRKLKQKNENAEKEYKERYSEEARNEKVEVAKDAHQWAKNENVDMKYKEKIQKLKEEVEKLKDGNDLLTQDNSKLQKELEANETWSKNLKQTNESLEREYKEMCDELQQTRQVKEQEKHSWNKRFADLLTKIESHDAQVKKLTFEKNDALTRLSELAGRRLVENNPAIADLSTEIRPTKIGENFMQVYDNEWTDAFEELQGRGINDDRCISILLGISQENFELATQFAKEFREKLFSTISSFPAEPQTASMKQNNTPKKGTKDEEQLINQLKRVSAARTMKSIQEFVKQSRDTKEKKYGEKCERYAEKCLEMCWYMAIQSPPLALIFEVNRLDPFDDKYFKKFVTTGDKFDFVVWPCILLHKDGPILAKGVAQAIKADSAKSNFSVSAARKESSPPPKSNVKENPPGKREADLHMKPQEYPQMRQGKVEKPSRQKAQSLHVDREKAQNKTDFRTTISVNAHSTQF